MRIAFHRFVLYAFCCTAVVLGAGCGSGQKTIATQTIIPQDSLLSCIKELTQVLAADGEEERLRQVFESRASRYKILLNKPADTSGHDKEMLQVYTSTIHIDSTAKAYKVELLSLPAPLDSSLSLAVLKQWFGPWKLDMWNSIFPAPKEYNPPVVFESIHMPGQKNNVRISVLTDPPADTLHGHISSISVLGSKEQ